MILTFFSSQGWESWDVGHRPLIPERMPVLVDDDLLFEDGPGAPRPVVAVNQWLRELPASGAHAPGTWEAYARAVKEWVEFLAVHGVGLFDSRERLKAGLSRYAEHRAAGPVRQRFSATTWGRHMSILSMFYRWAMEEGHAQAEPFTYRTARALFGGTGREVRVNLAVRRTPRPHVTIRYLEPDFTQLFLNGLRGLAPDGGPDAGYHGRELARNAAVGGLALATGLRLQEFTHLLTYEIPALPPRPMTIPDPVPGSGGGDQRTEVPDHVDFLRGAGGRPSLPGTGSRRDSRRLGMASAPAVGRAAAGDRARTRKVAGSTASASAGRPSPRASGGGWSPRTGVRACWR